MYKQNDKVFIYAYQGFFREKPYLPNTQGVVYQNQIKDGKSVIVTITLADGSLKNEELYIDQVSSTKLIPHKMKCGDLVLVSSLGSFVYGGFLYREPAIIQKFHVDGSVTLAVVRNFNGEYKLDKSYRVWHEQIIEISSNDHTLYWDNISKLITEEKLNPLSNKIDKIKENTANCLVYIAKKIYPKVINN